MNIQERIQEFKFCVLKKLKIFRIEIKLRKLEENDHVVATNNHMTFYWNISDQYKAFFVLILKTYSNTPTHHGFLETTTLRHFGNFHISRYSMYGKPRRTATL